MAANIPADPSTSTAKFHRPNNGADFEDRLSSRVRGGELLQSRMPTVDRQAPPGNFGVQIDFAMRVLAWHRSPNSRLDPR